MELENETYANEVDIYTNLKNEYLRELAASEQGLSVVTSADFGSSVNMGKWLFWINNNFITQRTSFKNKQILKLFLSAHFSLNIIYVAKEKK